MQQLTYKQEPEAHDNIANCSDVITSMVHSLLLGVGNTASCYCVWSLAFRQIWTVHTAEQLTTEWIYYKALYINQEPDLQKLLKWS